MRRSGSRGRWCAGPPRPVSPAGFAAAAMSPAALMRALPSWGWPGGWMRSPGSGECNARVIIAELGTSPSPPPHPRARRRLGPADPALQAIQGDSQARPHRQGQPVPARRARPGRDGRRQDRYAAGRAVPPVHPPQARRASRRPSSRSPGSSARSPGSSSATPAPATKNSAPTTTALAAPPARPGTRSARSSPWTPGQESSPRLGTPVQERARPPEARSTG